MDRIVWDVCSGLFSSLAAATWGDIFRSLWSIRKKANTRWTTNNFWQALDSVGTTHSLPRENVTRGSGVSNVKIFILERGTINQISTNCP